jgi:hypothetical protein
VIRIWEGPDGSTIRMAFDKFASLNGSYSQGAFLLNNPAKIEGEWVPHYESLGDAYPLRFSLASGTHNDLYLKSTRQTRLLSRMASVSGTLREVL